MTDPADQTEPDLAPYLARAGITLSPAQIEEYRPAFRHVMAMIALVGSGRSHLAEPAHVFDFPVGETGGPAA